MFLLPLYERRFHKKCYQLLPCCLNSSRMINLIRPKWHRVFFMLMGWALIFLQTLVKLLCKKKGKLRRVLPVKWSRSLKWYIMSLSYLPSEVIYSWMPLNRSCHSSSKWEAGMLFFHALCLNSSSNMFWNLSFWWQLFWTNSGPILVGWWLQRWQLHLQWSPRTQHEPYSCQMF